MDSGDTADGFDRTRLKPVLIVLHQEHSSVGHVGSLLEARGHLLDIRRPRFGDPLPATLADHAGTVIFGGPMSANDPDEFVKREIALIEMALRESSPYLGICLGAQMMAACLGAKVTPHMGGHVEIGYADVMPQPAATIGGPWPTRFYQWHSEGFGIPAGAELLALADGPFPNQAMRYGTAAVGVQFHPEITYAMAARWSARNELKNESRIGAHPRPQQLADHVAHGPAVRNWLGGFLDCWLAAGSNDIQSCIEHLSPPTSEICTSATLPAY